MEEFEDDDFEAEEDTRPPMNHHASKWMVLGAFFELLTDIAKAFAAFFDSLTDEALSKYRRQRNQDEFVQQASREIEMLTSGEYDAATFSTGRSIGPGAAESAD